MATLLPFKSDVHAVQVITFNDYFFVIVDHDIGVGCCKCKKEVKLDFNSPMRPSGETPPKPTLLVLSMMDNNQLEQDDKKMIVGRRRKRT